MLTIKEKMTATIKALPDDASYTEIMRELAFQNMIERGLEDARQGNVIDNDEMLLRIESRQQ